MREGVQGDAGRCAGGRRRMQEGRGLQKDVQKDAGRCAEGCGRTGGCGRRQGDAGGESDGSRCAGRAVVCGRTEGAPLGQGFCCGSSSAFQRSRFPLGILKFVSAPRLGSEHGALRQQGRSELKARRALKAAAAASTRGPELRLNPPHHRLGQRAGQSWRISKGLCGYRVGKLGHCQGSRTLTKNCGIRNHSGFVQH